ncbi:MAG: albusnodin/ikarugamycin family macrolactam cyclase, partial [Pseudonocardiaceae bacterium]
EERAIGGQPLEAGVGGREVAVFGPCSATHHDLHRLAAAGVTDAALTAFAGTYTVVESTPEATRVFTDPAHAQPIYLAATRTGTLWGSSARALAALCGTAPDVSWLATLLLAPDQPGLLAGRSAFTGVAAVPPGSCLVLAHGAQPQVRAAWRPEPAVADLNEGAGRLRTALAAAVAVRIDDSYQPSSDCSGGLDSTSLTLLAAAHLYGPATLHAVTIHPAGTGFGGDLDYAAAVVAEQPRIRHQPCPLDARHLPYSRMTELMPPTDEPAPTTVTIARAVAEFDLLRRLGSDCHLTGDGGDTLLGGHPAYLADLALSGRAGRLCRHGVGWARLRRSSVWPLVANAARTAIQSRRGSWSPTHRHGFPAWSTTSARELARKVIAPAPEIAPIPGGADATALMEAIQAVGRTARSDAQVAENYGVTVHNPFVDPQVIAAALSVPAWLRASPFRYKPLLATALDDLLPPTVAARRTKGDFTPDHYLGLRGNTRPLHALAGGRLAEHGLVDPDQLRRQLTRAEAGLPVAFSEFEPVLAVEVWLRTIEHSTPAARWAPVPWWTSCSSMDSSPTPRHLVRGPFPWHRRPRRVGAPAKSRPRSARAARRASR